MPLRGLDHTVKGAGCCRPSTQTPSTGNGIDSRCLDPIFGHRKERADTCH